MYDLSYRFLPKASKTTLQFKTVKQIPINESKTLKIKMLIWFIVIRRTSLVVDNFSEVLQQVMDCARDNSLLRSFLKFN